MTSTAAAAIGNIQCWEKASRSRTGHVGSAAMPGRFRGKRFTDALPQLGAFFAVPEEAGGCGDGVPLLELFAAGGTGLRVPAGGVKERGILVTEGLIEPAAFEVHD